MHKISHGNPINIHFMFLSVKNKFKYKKEEIWIEKSFERIILRNSFSYHQIIIKFRTLFTQYVGKETENNLEMFGTITDSVCGSKWSSNSL
jgi:hypothetical protein